MTLYVLLSCMGCHAVCYTSVGVTPGMVGDDHVDEGGAKTKTTSLSPAPTVLNADRITK